MFCTCRAEGKTTKALPVWCTVLLSRDSALVISPIPCRQLESPHISILCVPRLRLWQEVSVLFGRTQSVCLPNGIPVRVGGGAGSCSEDSLGLPRKQFLVSLVSPIWYIKEISPHSSRRVFLYSYIQQLNPFSYNQPCTRDLCSQEMGPISFPALACPRDAPSAVLLVWLMLPVPIPHWNACCSEFSSPLSEDNR